VNAEQRRGWGRSVWRGVVVGLGLTMVACGGAAPAGVATLAPPVPVPTQGAASAGPAPSGEVGEAVAQARVQIEQAVAGTEREDLNSLLRAAASVSDEGQRYQAYLGAWQYMRLIYLQQGQKPEHKAALDRIEAIARTFPEYRPEQFQVQKGGG
jgi:hypothetical protein